MRWFDEHVDGLLARWSEGTLSPRQSARLLRHAHACARCGGRYERLVQAHRMLERGGLHTPTEMEEAVLADAGLAAALSAAAPEAERWRWPPLAMVGGVVAALGLAALVLVPPGDAGEWQSRGVGRPTGAALRVFCAVRRQPLRELKREQACPPDAMLAFAVGASAPLSHVAVEVRGAGLQVSEGPFAVAGAPGAEQPLEATIPLLMFPGAAEVVAAFADSPRSALGALRGDGTPGAVVLRMPVRVEDSP
ncbi:hypothetical protein [Archangium lipolyticum]|uniref:hypothetical protein n=1 Tax=Archangium lipolyticum TaxID=2970465 RepID=UPI00214A2ED4|nr:hypothetical protein [Archangium lipolyticum]